MVCPKYCPDIGGVEEYVKNISDSLAHDHGITVFTDIRKFISDWN